MRRRRKKGGRKGEWRGEEGKEGGGYETERKRRGEEGNRRGWREKRGWIRNWGTRKTEERDNKKWKKDRMKTGEGKKILEKKGKELI